ncbi:MAG: cobalt ECF transporter T component CbiQ [Bacteroidota bacterium]
MKHNFIDRYARGDSAIHRIAPGVKMGSALAVVVITVAVPEWPMVFYGGLVAAMCVVAAMARIPAGFMLRRLLTLQPFIVGGALFALAQPEGWSMAARVLVKSNICLATMILLANTTRFSSMLDVLSRLHAPSLLITILSLMYRYVFLLIDQTERMARARRSRMFIRGRRSWRHTAGIVGHLFVRSVERAERVYAAMTARGWR